MPKRDRRYVDKILEINDLKEIAKKNLPKMFYDYDTLHVTLRTTYARNEDDFKNIKLKQR